MLRGDDLTDAAPAHDIADGQVPEERVMTFFQVTALCRYRRQADRAYQELPVFGFGNRFRCPVEMIGADQFFRPGVAGNSPLSIGA